MAQAETGGTILGHPRGLAVLFLTEMWERFSYYGMRALLIYYLTEYFLFADDPAYGIFGAYTSLAYLTPLLGGVIADRYLGARRAITIGGVLIMLGHIGMAYHGTPATAVAGTVTRDAQSLQILYLSLALIIVGTGLLKPNVSSIVGALYPEGDRRRDSGYSIYYMGINLGAFLAPIVCGALRHGYGWSWGFGAAAVGMALGLLCFTLGRRWLDGAGEPPDAALLTRRAGGGLSVNGLVIAGCVLAVVPVWGAVQLFGGLLAVHPGPSAAATIAVCVLIGASIMAYAFTTLEAVERDRIAVILILVAFATVFWACFEQAGSSIAMFSKRGVELGVFGLTLTPEMVQSINPIFIIALAPVFAMIWLSLARREADPNIPLKFALGLAQIGLGFGLFVLGIATAAPGEKVALIWLVAGLFLHTTGELCVSPVGLSAVSKLSIPRLVGLMMGVWFLSSAVAHAVAALIAMTASVKHAPGEDIAVAEALPVYGDAFTLVMYVALGAAVLLLLLTPWLRKMMHGVR